MVKVRERLWSGLRKIKADHNLPDEFPLVGTYCTGFERFWLVFVRMLYWRMAYQSTMIKLPCNGKGVPLALRN